MLLWCTKTGINSQIDLKPEESHNVYLLEVFVHIKHTSPSFSISSNSFSLSISLTSYSCLFLLKTNVFAPATILIPHIYPAVLRASCLPLGLACSYDVNMLWHATLKLLYGINTKFTAMTVRVKHTTWFYVCASTCSCNTSCSHVQCIRIAFTALCPHFVMLLPHSKMDWIQFFLKTLNTILHNDNVKKVFGRFLRSYFKKKNN